MIRYAIRCKKDHEFDAWFKDSATFDAQASKGKVACPICGSKKIEKAPMAPAVAKSREAAPLDSKKESQVRQFFRAMRKHVEENADYVGDKFPDEARKIHYGETEERGIYGEATLEDAKELLEEGIDVMPLPALPRQDA